MFKIKRNTMKTQESMSVTLMRLMATYPADVIVQEYKGGDGMGKFIEPTGTPSSLLWGNRSHLKLAIDDCLHLSIIPSPQNRLDWEWQVAYHPASGGIACRIVYHPSGGSEQHVQRDCPEEMVRRILNAPDEFHYSDWVVLSPNRTDRDKMKNYAYTICDNANAKLIPGYASMVESLS